ncbi:hypothetical protein [Chitinophaga sp. CF418]|uniref:putative polyvalent protein kinase domain-containing protein n=1 Tax=Chitinophaga sp. CF418 TaxID=1855287 RepID=UPI00165FC0C4
MLYLLCYLVGFFNSIVIHNLLFPNTCYSFPGFSLQTSQNLCPSGRTPGFKPKSNETD